MRPPEAAAVVPSPLPLRLLSRKAWRADESLRFDARGLERWPRVTAPLRGVVIHHSSSPNGDPAPAARVRAIYAFHAVARGWGDMGYHLLIDETGTVYEGRAGTAGVLHGAPAVIGAHVYGHNAGTVGIALLGTLNERPPSAAACGALVAVLSRLAERHGLDPLAARSTGAGGVVPTICTHRDLAPATCPGDACHHMLPELRARVAAAVGAVSGRVTAMLG
jgi:N-acetylmuramoyl-L-alanine amidase